MTGQGAVTVQAESTSDAGFQVAWGFGQDQRPPKEVLSAVEATTEAFQGTWADLQQSWTGP